MKLALPSSLLALALCIPALAHAQEAAPAAPATEPAKADASLEAAKSAAEAAKSAAEAAKASADALRELMVQMKAAPAPVVEAPVVEAPAAPATPPAWNYQLGVSFLSVTGNANALTGKLSGQATGKFGNWGAKITGGAMYGQSYAATAEEAEVTALNANLGARGERSLSKMFNVYLAAGGATDRVASISSQVLGEAGAGLIWFENVEGDFVKSKLSTDLGFRYTREARATYYPEFSDLPDIDIYAIALKGSFRFALSKTAVFTQDLEVLPDVVNTNNLRLTSVSALSAQVDQGIALSIGFKARYIGAPAAGAKSTDTELSAGVTWAF